MAIRDTIRTWLGIDSSIREALRRELAARSLPSATEVESLRTQVAELEATVAKLDKKVKMTMGSVQASTAQLMGVHQTLDALGPAVAKATQQATRANSTAESTADGLDGVEEQLAALLEKIAAD
jgi:chromosome segregation ATPase